MYRVYFGPPGSGAVRPLEKEKWPSKSFVDLPEALLWAHGAAANGTVILKIEGGGTELDRSEIAGCLNALSLGREESSSRGG